MGKIGKVRLHAGETEIMHSKNNKTVRAMIGAVLTASVVAASITGCTPVETQQSTDGMRDGNDNNTYAST